MRMEIPMEMILEEEKRSIGIKKAKEQACLFGTKILGIGGIHKT